MGGIPVMIIAYENPRALYFVEMFIIFIVCMSLILFTFWPKVQLNRKVQLGTINMQNVIKEFSEQAHVYRFKKKFPTEMSSIFPSITIQNMKSKSFTSTTLMNEQESSGKKTSISTEVGKIDEELTRKYENNQSKSHDLEILESNEDKIMEEVEDNFTMDIRPQSDDEFTKLREEMIC